MEFLFFDRLGNPVLNFMRRRFRVTDGLRGERFCVRQPLSGTGAAAIFAITTDRYIIYTSNIFAILGLRALCFALSAMLHRFVYPKTALALVLIFIGGKVFAAELLGIDKVHPASSLAVTAAILIGGAVLSLRRTRPEPTSAVLQLRTEGLAV